MENYEVKKHWWNWVTPAFVSLIFCWTIIVPIWVLGYTFLRLKLDKIEVKDGCLHSRLGIIFINKKSIPLNQISYIGEKTNIIAQWLGFGDIEVQSSAFAKAIFYPCVEEPQKFIQFVNDNKKL